MGIPIGSTFTSKVSGRAIKPVECFKCSGMFAYEMTRTASGSGSSLLWLDNDGAAFRAADAAEKKLKRAMEKQCDIVACPMCGSYQPDMVKRLRRRRMWWSIAAVVTAWLVLGEVRPLLTVIAPVFSLSAGGQATGGQASPAGTMIGTILTGLWLASIGASFIWPRFWDPNARAAERVGDARTNPALITEAQFEEWLGTRHARGAWREADAL